ncbi:unnamed protein product [Cylicocyclus nassatus]|uniref:Uncharacterized protein n=1 Tax=Cylicocyclus nassatus TaxID=53992 RepID=A0AA36GDL5_CYLNA|nr:unnamed protein product [Cylicocyclus nassatus]
MGLLALFQINRFMIKRYTGYGVKLSVRYQLSENIRTIRVFLPMITSDSFISLVDIVYHYLNLDYVFEPERCQQDPLYLRLYVVIVGIASAIELVGATSVTFMYPSIKLPCRRKKNLESVPVINVLGSDLMVKQKERNHFVDLDKLWELRTRFGPIAVIQ